MKSKYAVYLLAMVLCCFSCDLNVLNERLARQEPFSDIVTVQEIKSMHAVNLTWRKDVGADNYIVMRSINDENGLLEFLPIYRGAEWTYTDLDIEVAVTYAYRLDKARGNKIIEADRHVYYTRPLPFEGTITAQSVNEGRSAYLAWEADENADKYIVMKTEAGSGGINFNDQYVTQKIELADTCSYVDNDIVREKSYAYRLDKVCGNRVFEGTEITFLGKSRPDPFSGTIVIQSLNNGKSAYLSWQADVGADEYRVMRTLNDGSGNAGLFSERQNGTDGFFFQGATAALDSMIDADKSYAYRLDKICGERVFEGTVITVLDRSRPDPFPGAITVQKMNDGLAVYLLWQADEGADEYRVMRASNDGGAMVFAQRRSGVDGFLPQGTTAAIDSIAKDKSYAYRLDKVNSGRVFEGAEIIFVAKSRPDPFPGAIIAQNLNSGKSAYLSWQADEGADAYRVMRAVDDGNPLVFQDRAGGAGFFMQGTTSAIDSNLEDDKGYFYRLDKQRDNVWIVGLEITAFSRTRPMPFADTPVVKSFNVNGSILISWKYDEGADTYIVRRSFDKPPTSNINDFNTVVYEGTALQFIDTAVEEDGRYVYKLYKRRNGIIYPQNSQTYDGIALGVSVRMQEDTHEPNNTEPQATLLESVLQANIYCYGFSLPDHILEDVDWYKVSIPAYKTAHIVVEYNDDVKDNEHLLFKDPVMGTYTITHARPFEIKNDAAIQKYVAFAIVPDRFKILTVGIGGTVVSYTLRWHSITNNN
ncbi:MAG: hypothetical protein LBH20_00935 [Treponema sp.]|jgi:hypothetical protein|nr:hypothetical protein [Treponema sp.]